ncbi:MAG: hypothetical protein WDN72_06570 [Alphaproteobacteria bacterium]
MAPFDENKPGNDYDGQLSFGTYIGKEVYQLAVSFGSLIGGWYAGLGIGKVAFNGTAPAAKQAEWAEGLGKSGFVRAAGLKTLPGKAQMISGVVGMFAGSILGGLVLGYGHWKKEKQAQMQVDELTKDISDIEVFRKTDPELKQENQRLWKMLKDKEGEAPQPRVSAENASHEGRAAESAGQAAALSS